MKQPKFLLTVIYGSPRCHLNSSKTFKKNRKKLKHIFLTMLGLAESFIAMNRPEPTVTVLTASFSEDIRDRDVKFWHNIHSSLQFKIEKIFFTCKNKFLHKKLRFFLTIFIKLLPKFSDFINYDDCIGRITSKYIRQYAIFIQNII